MEEGTTNEEATAEADSAARDLILELNFVPKWARVAPDQARATGGEGEEDRGRRGDRWSSGRDRERGDRDRRFEGKAGPRRERGAGMPSPRGGGRLEDRRRQGGYGGDRREGPQQGGPPRGPDARYESRYAAPEILPLRIRFFPEQKRLSAVMRRLHLARRCYPLGEIASLFLARPEACCIKIESEPGDGGLRLHQCRLCGTVTLDKAMLIEHVVSVHVQEFFQKEETVGEAPAGEFVCVARCGLSGQLLGPPNHHSYPERVREVHRERYPNMPFAEYTSRIEMCHDKEAVEKWKEESRRQTQYRLKTAAAGEASMKWVAAQAFMREQVAPGAVQESNRLSFAVDAALAVPEERLRRTVRVAWDRERRFMRSMSLSVRTALRNRDFHFFRAGTGMEFVTAVRPSPLDPTHAVESIREVLHYLQQHPGCSRQSLVEALRPGQAYGSPEAEKVLSPLTWLIDKGHIIEFWNGTLAVPLAARREEPRPPADQAKSIL